MQKQYFIYVSVGVVLLSPIVFSSNRSIGYLALKTLMLVCVFGIALCLGAKIRKERLKNKAEDSQSNAV